MVFNATFNNTLAKLWRSVLLVEETVVPRENHLPGTSRWQTLSHNAVSPWPWFELTTLVVIGTDCIGSCRSNHHTITTTTTPTVFVNSMFTYITLKKKTWLRVLYNISIDRVIGEGLHFTHMWKPHW